VRPTNNLQYPYTGELVRKAQTRRDLMGKGRKKKIVTLDEFGEEDKSKTIYKWSQQRKK